MLTSQEGKRLLTTFYVKTLLSHFMSYERQRLMVWIFLRFFVKF